MLERHSAVLCPLPCGTAPRLAFGTAGDHPVVSQMLCDVFNGSAQAAFPATLDDPHYEPCDRLLVKGGPRILAHLQMTRRVLQFGPLRHGVSGLQHFATLPEHRQRGYGRTLLGLAEDLMAEDGSGLGIVQTAVPKFFCRRGWAVCGRHCYSRAGVRDLLAQLSADGTRWPKHPLKIRPWRQVELPDLMRLHRQWSDQFDGATQRTEAYWRWIVGRGDHDRIFVAIDGADPAAADDDVPCNAKESQIVGYLVMRDDRILELATDPGHATAAHELLARAASEAIERDCHVITLLAPPNDPLHETFRQARGTSVHNEIDQGEVFMIKVLDVLDLMRSMCPLLHDRAAAAGITRPTEFAIAADGQRYRVLLTRRSVKVSRERSGRRTLTCSGAELTRLLLGHNGIEEAIDAGRAKVSSRVVAEIVSTILPARPLWYTPWDFGPV
ncbi:MAG: GNAT family N-acetyltransferase [Planctomycetales bacterium]|nr:GNAT family N-acetyltransferase [Planctomycetales bacterium]